MRGPGDTHTGEEDVNRCGEESHLEAKERGLALILPSSPQSRLADAWIETSELRASASAAEAPSWWDFVMAALANSCRQPASMRLAMVKVRVAFEVYYAVKMSRIC